MSLCLLIISTTYSYYAEEKNLTAPARSTAGGGGGIKLYGKDLRDLDDADLEGLLSKLSPEELEDLNNDFDPDVRLCFVYC